MDMSRPQISSSAPFVLRAPNQMASPVTLTPKVFVVDEDASVRNSLEHLATRAGWQVETFALADDFLARPRAFEPGCLVLDAELSDLTALEIQRRLADHPELPIIFLSGSDDVQTVVLAMKAGAVDFLTKPLAVELLLGAMRDAIERSRVTLARRAALDVLRLRYASLSSREREVMAHVVGGRLNKQTAFDLGISEITVKAHRGNMMRKMAARSVPDIVHMAEMLIGAARSRQE